MPPVECTSLASGAEAPQYLALSPCLVEDYNPFMDYNHPLMYRPEVLLSSAALPDTPNPLVSLKNTLFTFLCNFFCLCLLKKTKEAKEQQTYFLVDCHEHDFFVEV
jgi:hypothetical protein